MQYLCLVIESDAEQTGLTQRVLERCGLRAHRVAGVASALDALRQMRFDVVLLDVDRDGAGVAGMLALLREKRVPIVVRAGPCDDETQLLRLEQGATALVPRHEPLRLTALRLRKLAELGQQEAREPPPEVRLGPLRLDTRRARASVLGQPLELSARQLDILLVLATRPGEFVHRRELAGGARAAGEEGSRSVDMHVSRLRGKLRVAGPSGLAIDTVHGLGYCLSFREAAAALEQAM